MEYNLICFYCVWKQKLDKLRFRIQTMLTFQGTEAALAEAVGTMIDHITEMAIVTATDRAAAIAATAAAAAAVAVAAGADGPPRTGSAMTAGTVAGTIGTTFTTIAVGKNLGRGGNAVIAATAAAGAAGTIPAAAAVGPMTIGRAPCPVMRGWRLSCSRGVTGHRVSTLIGMRTFRSRPLGRTCPTASKM